MKKIGHLELNTQDKEDRPPYRGVIQTRSGIKTITAFCGRDRDFCDYLKCFVQGNPNRIFRATTSISDREGHYYANLNEKKLVQLTFKRVWNKHKNIIESFDIYLE